MSEQRHDICLRLHLESEPERVFELLSTDEGRESFWVSVLMNLKARADHGVDLRNHDPARTWTKGYVDN